MSGRPRMKAAKGSRCLSAIAARRADVDDDIAVVAVLVTVTVVFVLTPASLSVAEKDSMTSTWASGSFSPAVVLLPSETGETQQLQELWQVHPPPGAFAAGRVARASSQV